jgi:hypothetical protein
LLGFEIVCIYPDNISTGSGRLHGQHPHQARLMYRVHRRAVQLG